MTNLFKPCFTILELESWIEKEMKNVLLPYYQDKAGEYLFGLQYLAEIRNSLQKNCEIEIRFREYLMNDKGGDFQYGEYAIEILINKIVLPYCFVNWFSYEFIGEDFTDGLTRIDEDRFILVKI
jgi:hypothetical protein